MLTTFLKNTFVLLFLLASCYNLIAQDHQYTHYGVEDGLPSSEVYFVFQDSKGYMWFATDAGVSRFNGYEFENFDMSNGLTDNTVFLIDEDPEGRIWFGTFNLKLCYYQDGKIYPYQYNDKIANYFEDKGGLIVSSLKVDADKTLWMGTKSRGLIKINRQGILDVLIDNVDSNFLILDSNSLISGVDVNRLDNDSQIIEFNNKYRDLLTMGQADTSIGSLIYVVVTGRDFAVCYYSPLNALLLGIKNKYEVKRLKGFSFIKKKVSFCYYDQDHFWISVLGQGVYECQLENDSIEIVNHYLMGKQVSSIFKDEENGFWFPTLTEGIYYLSSSSIEVSAFRGRSVSSVAVDTVSNDLYSSLSSGAVYSNRMIKMKEKKSLKKITESNVNMIHIKYGYEKKQLYIGDLTVSEGMNFFKNGKVEKISSSHYNSGFKALIFESDTIYKVNQYGFSIMVNEKEVYFSHPENPRMWCTSLVKNGGKIWIGTNQGVRIFEGVDKKIKHPFQKNKYLSSAITSMERLNDNFFLIGTKSYGLLVVRNDSIIDVIDQEKGLVGNLVKTIHVDNQQTIWVGTNNGLSRINCDDQGVFDIYNVTTKHGLISGEINDIDSYRATIYLATTKGLVEFDRRKLKENDLRPPVYITSFNVNEQERTVDENLELSYKENNLNIAYEGLNYRSLGDVTYQYRMLGVDTNWITTTSRSVRYPTLPHNEYTFEIKAKNEDGYWSETERFSFKINPPTWLTWWFITVLIILGLLIVYLVFRYQVKQIRSKASVEKKMVELELKALRAQMNPHFIFNTLNSIQYFIGKNNFVETNRYITKFSKLIRTVLNLSEKSVIAIEEEIEMLTLYLDLEKMRFDEQFDYSIQIGEEVDAYYDTIPSMLIQPYVENAIWHGLMNTTKKGKITIEVNRENNDLKCVVTDNGIGREAASRIKAKRNINHKSVGMTITKERLDLMSDEKRADINVEIVDLYDNKNGVKTVKGTKVIVKIPL